MILDYDTKCSLIEAINYSKDCLENGYYTGDIKKLKKQIRKMELQLKLDKIKKEMIEKQ